MMTSFRKTVLILLLTVFCAAGIYAEDVISIATKQDFLDLVELWNTCSESGDYAPYQEKLSATAGSVIPEELYQYMLGETLFYEYYGKPYTSLEADPELDAVLEETVDWALELEPSYPVLTTVFNLFRSFQKYRPFSAAVENATVKPVPATETRSLDTASLPSAQDARLLLLRTLTEAEAMDRRLKKASEARGGVQLKLSQDAFIKVMEKPAMVYIIDSEPAYATLKEAVARSSEGVGDISYGYDADAYYQFEEFLVQCEAIAPELGLSLSDILSPEAYYAVSVYHADRFQVLCLKKAALDRLSSELAYVIADSELYVRRINRLPSQSAAKEGE